MASTTFAFSLRGSTILDSTGRPFIMKGINHAYGFFKQQNQAFADIKSTGSNTIRIVLTGADTLDNLRFVIAESKKHKLVAIVENHDATGFGDAPGAKPISEVADWWVRMKEGVVGQEEFVILNIANEPFGNNNFQGWANETVKAVQKLRAAGIRNQLMVDGPNWGQDWSGLMSQNAPRILASDPLKNVVFSVHMYGVYSTPAKVTSYIDSYLSRNLAIVVGEFGFTHTDGEVDEQTIISYTAQKGVGILAWSWSGNSGGVEYLDLVAGWDRNRPSAWGTQVFNVVRGSAEAGVFAGIAAAPQGQTGGTATATTTTTTARTTRTTTAGSQQTPTSRPNNPPQANPPANPAPANPQPANRPPQTGGQRPNNPAPANPQPANNPPQTGGQRPNNPPQPNNQPQTNPTTPAPAQQPARPATQQPARPATQQRPANPAPAQQPATPAGPPSNSNPNQPPILLHIASDPTLNPPTALSSFSCNSGTLQGTVKLDITYTFPLSTIDATYKHAPHASLGLPRVRAVFELVGAPAMDIQVVNSYNSRDVKVVGGNSVEFGLVAGLRTTGFFARFGSCRSGEADGAVVDGRGRLRVRFESVGEVQGATGLERGVNGGPSVEAFNGRVGVVSELPRDVRVGRR
ncbi:hypothetical protein HDV05_004759 [Chytridiales sp. JEL 0842]|nr:hypothetical protein HDV05_004759 [Chytridiales sp. JEL 0842]